MRILFSILIITSILACAQKETSSDATDKKNQAVPTKSKSKKTSKKIPKGDLWVEMKKELNISDNQIVQLKAASKERNVSMKSTDANRKKTAPLEYNNKLSKILGDSKLVRDYKRFNSSWNNPLSYYNLKNSLDLTPKQARSINKFKRESRIARRDVNENNPIKKKSILDKIKESEVNKIMAELSVDQNEKFDDIKKRLTPQRLSKVEIFQ